MAFQSLKAKLLVAVVALVIVSGLLIALLVTQRYAKSLQVSVIAQAENVAHALSLEAAEKILINDLVALQKMLDHLIKSNPSINYLFVIRDGRILAHTFAQGVPSQLIISNSPVSSERHRLQKIGSTTGEHYLDIAWPIFSGKGGTLRVGFSERSLTENLTGLWLEISFLTLGILLMAVLGSLIYVKRITLPLDRLAKAVQKVDEGALDIQVNAHGNDEVAKLAASFNLMVERIHEYTQRLQEKGRELERSHDQTRAFCEIVREIGALPTFREVGSTLIRKFGGILNCDRMALLILSQNPDALYVLSETTFNVVTDNNEIPEIRDCLETRGNSVWFKKPALAPPVVPNFFGTTPRQAVIPIENDHQLCGALVVACPGDCDCNLKEMDWVSLILTQSAGVIRRSLLQEEASSELHKRMEKASGFRGIIGKDPKMQLIYKLIEDIAPTDATVLVQGESGTGKELVARAIHLESERRDKPFVVINCSAYPDTLIESELFGHEKGSFTGAVRRKIGRFEQADGGTVFLDEIGEIPSQVQIKLLRVLQTQTFERLGGEETVAVDVRVLAATNKNLLQEVQQGNFREDLFYRLNVIPVLLPPLRERRNDIPMLANHFRSLFSDEQGKEIRELSPEAMRLILDYEWPGNVRELENSLEHAVVLAKAEHVEVSDLPASLIDITIARSSRQEQPSLYESEKTLLESVLAGCGWNKKEAARRLGIGRSTLYAKLKKYQITKPTLQ
jgi:DNA-binding NtrC family response regulator/HAMP domain-containing protein